MRSAKTGFESRYGRFEVSWRIEGGEDRVRDKKEGKGCVLKVEVEVPPNAKARVLLEGKETVDKWVGSGKYSFQVPWVDDMRWEKMEAIQGAQGNAIESHFVP